MKRIACIAIFFFLSGVSHADQYLCVAGQTTGFAFDEKAKKWVVTSFKNEDDKFIVSEAGDTKSRIYESVKYNVTKLGSSSPSFRCEYEFTNLGFLFCKATLRMGTFKFNRINGRYLRTYSVGYYNVLPDETDKTSDTPFVEIGTCSPF